MASLAFIYQPYANEKLETLLIAFISKARGIDSWNHPFVGLFLIETKFDLDGFDGIVSDFMGDKTKYFIAEFSDFLGQLPHTTWDWMRENGFKFDLRTGSKNDEANT